MKITQIKKRNGKIIAFEQEKITVAIGKAGKETGEFGFSQAQKLSQQVIEKLQQATTDIPTVEQVQDIVENILLGSCYKKTAKAYILYRNQHKQLRDIANAVNNGLIDDYLNKSDWQVRENSNMSYSLQGLHNYISSEVSKNYWLHKIYPEPIRMAHTTGDFHIHDLNILSVYCVGWDLFDLLLEGFTGVAGKISSKPPKHFRSALGQVVNFFYTLQGEAAGAQAFSNFDTLLAPFIRHDKLGYREVKQALQEFLFNVNVPTRVGFQTPFTNVTLDLAVPQYYADQPVVIGGRPQKETYGEFQEEMALFNKAFLEVMAEGDASGRVFTFPIPTYNMTKDFDWDSEICKLLWRVTGKYGLPYFSNFINSAMNPEDARSMCCRLRIDNRQLEKRGGGLFGANPLTGSIGVVTINLPRIGYEVKTQGQFLARLKELMVLAKDSLEIKRKVLEKFTEANLYPYTRFYLRGIKARHECYWKNHFSTIGIVGMNEALLNLFGEGIATDKGRKFAEEVLDFMRDTLLMFQMETGNNYNLEATPAEGTSYRLALCDQKRFRDSNFANGKGKEPASPFYTNSTHLPVNYTNDLFEALDLQDALQTRYTGGTVVHLYLGERIEDGEGVKNLVRKVCNSYHLPYFTISPTFSVCPNHGYLAGEVHVCDQCGTQCEIYSRVVGYLRPIDQWNDGKQAEFHIRKTYGV
ncbi:MAG TPA: ribonucleoside triphosphate reductase [Anaerolineaceae bacterium]|mgnify:CR=1 FL=1|nr:ribonucleoside triphosphate reductase [Anaerolineaceae bacterium]